MRRRYLAIGAALAALCGATVGGLTLSGVTFASSTTATFSACLKTGRLSAVTETGTPTCGSKATLVTWNQEGAPGPRGKTGAQGPPGVGYDFTTASGISPEATLAPGAYFVDVEFYLTGGSTGVTGSCGVAEHAATGNPLGLFTAAVAMIKEISGHVSVSGILQVNTTPASLTPRSLYLGCTKITGATLAVSDVKWWYSPVG